MVQIASVDIGTRLDLSGFYQGFGSLSGVKTPVVKLGVIFDNANITQGRQRLQKALSQDLIIKVKVDDVPLTQLNKHIESKRTHVKDVNVWFGKNPLKIRTTTEPINGVSLKKQVVELSEQLETKVKVKAEVKENEGEKLSLTLKDGIEKSFDNSSGKIDNVFKNIANSQQKSNSSSRLTNFLTAPLSQAMAGIFTGVGLPLGEKIGAGITRGLELRYSIDLENVGLQLENYATRKITTLADAALENIGLSTKQISVDIVRFAEAFDKVLEPEPIGRAIKKAETLLVKVLEDAFVFKDFSKSKAYAREQLGKIGERAKEVIQSPGIRPYAGATLRVAAYPFKLRRSIEALRQYQEAEKMAQGIKVDDIGDAKSLTLAIAGKNNVQGKGSAVIAHEIQSLTGSQSHVVPVANPYTDSGLAGIDYFVEEILANADKGILGAINNLLKARGIEVKKLSEKLTGEKSFAQAIYNVDKSGSLLGLEQMVTTGGVLGHNPDAVSATAHAIAYRKAYPDLPINIIGHSGGGEVAQGSAEMLSKGGIAVNAVGLGTPTTGLVYAGNVGDQKANYTSLMGDTDFINWQFFDDSGLTETGKQDFAKKMGAKEYSQSPLVGLFPPSLAPLQYTKRSGHLHSLPAYLAGATAQQAMAEKLAFAIPSVETDGKVKANVPKEYQSAKAFEFIRDRELKSEIPIKAIESLSGDKISPDALRKSLTEVDKSVKYFSELTKLKGEVKKEADEYVAFLKSLSVALKQTLLIKAIPTEEFKVALDEGAKFHKPIAEVQKELSPVLAKEIATKKAKQAEESAQKIRIEEQAKIVAEKNKTNLYRYSDAVKNAISLPQDPTASTRDLVEARRDIDNLVKGIQEDASNLVGVTKEQIENYIQFLGNVRTNINASLNGEPLKELDNIITQSNNYFNKIASDTESVIPPPLEMPLATIKEPEFELLDARQLNQPKILAKLKPHDVPDDTNPPVIPQLPTTLPRESKVVGSIAKTNIETPLPSVALITQQTTGAMDTGIVEQLSNRVAAIRKAVKVAQATVVGNKNISKAYIDSVSNLIPNIEAQIQKELDQLSPRERVGTPIGNQLSNLKAQLSKVDSWVKGFLDDIAQPLKTVTNTERPEKTIKGLGAQFSQLLKAAKVISKTDPEAGQKIAKNILELADEARATIDSLVTNTNSQSVKIAAKNARRLITHATNSATGIAQDGTKSANNIGTDTSRGLVKGLTDSIPVVSATTRQLAETVIKSAEKTLEIQSPSKVFQRIGRFVIEGFQKGLKVNPQQLGFVQGLVEHSENLVQNKAYSVPKGNQKAIASVKNEAKVVQSQIQALLSEVALRLAEAKVAETKAAKLEKAIQENQKNILDNKAALEQNKDGNLNDAEIEILKNKIIQLEKLIPVLAKEREALGNPTAKKESLENVQIEAESTLKSVEGILSQGNSGSVEKNRLTSFKQQTATLYQEINKPLGQTGFLENLGLKIPNIATKIFQATKAFLFFQATMTAQNMLSQFGRGATEAAIALESLERRFLFISNNAQEAGNSLAFVRGETARLGTDLKSSMEGYVSLGAATRDTALESQTQKIFSGVSQASTVYDLNSEQQSRVFAAVQQMAGKGKVSAEELRQQLGEVLPGAFNIAARAMGVTTQTLDKMMSQGKLLSEDFLPKFAQQLSAETAMGVKGAANSSVSALIKFNNALFQMQATIGKTLLPIKNLLLALGSGAIKFVIENADFLLGVFRALAVMAGVNLFQSFGALTTALMKIPGVASAASAAMGTFQKILGNGDNKLKAAQLVEGLGDTLQNVRANPVQSLKSGASNVLSSVKDFGIAMLDNAKGGLSALNGGLISLQKNGISNIGANFTRGAIGVRAFGKAALINGVAGFIGLASGAKALIAAIAPVLTMFVVIEVGMKVFEGISAAFKDASGDSRNFADTATESLQKYREALAESRGETEKFKATKLVRDESLLDAMGIGALLPKEIKADANWFDKLRFGTGKAVTGLVESPANLLKKLSGGRVGSTYEDKKLGDNINATSDLSLGVNATTSEALSLLGTKGQGVRELGQLKQYDDQLRQIQTRRAALVAINPQDKAGLKVIDDEQTKILEAREKISKPIGILQSNMQSNVDMLRKEIEKYQKLANEPGKNQAQYKNVLTGLESDLTSAQKAQDKFNRAVGESVNAFSLMQKNIQGVVDKLADAEDSATVTGNTLKSSLYTNSKTQGELQFGLSELDIQQQETKVKRLLDAQSQAKALLQNKDAQNTLQAYGITENTGRAELKTISEKAGERVNDKYVIDQYLTLQERSVEISNLQAGVEQGKYEFNQKLFELNKQIEEYYRSASRQFAESSLEAQRQTSQLKVQSYATDIKTSISGFQDNIVSQFADSVIESIQQLSEAADKQFDVGSATLQANNAFEDSLRQGEELRRQLPGISTKGSIDIPAIPIELDLSKIGIDNKIIDITKAFNSGLQEAKDTIKDSESATNNLTSAFQDVTLGSLDFGDTIQQAVATTEDGIYATQGLGSELLNTTFTASDLGFAIETNTDSINSNNDAVIATNDSLFASLEATGNVTASTINWGAETSNVGGVIENGLKVALDSLPLSIQEIIKNTVDWFSTFANNIPILNSIGQIFSGWGQQLDNVSQSVASFGQGVMQTASNVVQQGVGFVRDALGISEKPPVGNTSQPVFPIAGVTAAQAESRKTSPWGMRRHPVTGQMKMHRGQDFGYGEGTQVVSPMAGVVTGVKYQAGGAGKYVVVESIDEQGRKIEHKFFHLSAYDVVEGQKLNAGDKIGKVGSTGIGTGAHLHYETWINGKNVNPTEFLAGRNGRGLSSAQKGQIEQHHPGDGHNHGGSVTPVKQNQAQRQGGAPKLGEGYEALNELGGQLSQNKYFDPSTAEGRGRLALALGIGGSEAFEKDTNRRAFYTYRGGTGNNMQGFGQFNNAYHKEIINTPEKYQNFFGQILAGERRLPNSQKGIGDYGSKVIEAVQSGRIKDGADLIRWMQANKLGGSNWQGVDDGWKRNPDLANQLVSYLKGGLPTQQKNTPNNTANVQIPQVANVPTPTVWTPGSIATRGNAAISDVTGRAEQQRERQVELARQKASNEAAQNTANALRTSNKAFLDLERELRQNGIKVNSLSNQVTDTNLEYKGALDNEQKRQQEQRQLETKYTELENSIIEQSKAIESQIGTARALLSKGGVVSPEMREKVQKLIDDPTIKENLREQLRTALTTGVLGDDGKNILNRAVVEGEDQLKKLTTGLDNVRKGREESKKLLDDRFAAEEKARKQQAGFDIENASIDTLKAKLDQLQQLKSTAPFSSDVQSIPDLEALISAREEQLNLEKQLKEIQGKEKAKEYTKEEADRLRAEIGERKKILDVTLKQKTENAKLAFLRESEARDREARNELVQAEIANDKVRIEQLKTLAQTNPLSSELANNAIGELEKRVTLREVELQLAQELVAIEQAGIEGKRTPDEITKLKAEKQSEYDVKIQNINAQAQQTAFASQISQSKVILSIKEQELQYQKQIADTTVQAINLGLQQGDPIKLKFEVDKKELEISVEKQILDMKEFANSTGKSQEEIAELELRIRGLNNLTLGNLKGEFDKALNQRTEAISQRVSGSQVELLDTQASFYSNRGMTNKARTLQRDSAVLQQQSAYRGQKTELEEFIRTTQVGAIEADKLRQNLEQVNRIKFDTIKDNFNAFKPVIDTVQTGLKGFFAGIIKGGQSIGDLFKGLMDSILGSVAEIASNYLVEKLFGGILGKKKNEGQGGMFAQGDSETSNPLSLLDGGSELGTTPVLPMYVNVVNGNTFGGLNNDTLGNVFGGKEDSTTSFLSSTFSGFTGKVDSTNPVPVGIIKSAPDALSPITNALGGIFGGKGGFGSIVSGIGGLFSGGGKSVGGLGGILGSVGGMFGGGGGLGGILGIASSLLGGFFWNGGVVGNYAQGGIADAIGREKALNGGRGVALAALTHGERVLNLAQTQNLDKMGGVDILNFSDGGTVGYVPKTTEYGGSADKVIENASRPKDINVKLETQIINGVEYLTKAQGEDLARKAAQQGAEQGARYISDRMINSPSYRATHGI